MNAYGPRHEFAKCEENLFSVWVFSQAASRALHGARVD